ncbi:MAG TPA: PRC and DUF2382 domain-containing protein [Dermatophilaceae bacterium]|nr:PRC and DUF2382 domain-containing protein [Dermatophilaceae bacterium]
MINEQQLDSVIGSTVYDTDGDKIGKVGQLYLDDATGKPEWVTVQTGLFGTKETFVPVAGATMSDDGLRVPFDQALVKGAPSMDADGHLDEGQEQELYDYYGVAGAGDRPDTELAAGRDYSDTSDVAGAGDRPDTELAAGRDYSDTDTAYRPAPGNDVTPGSPDDSLTRSEERLKVGTEKVETGRARLRKYVVTEEQSVTVPVSREEVRLVREPVTEGERAVGGDIADGEAEVVLHEERPVVTKEAVPVEKVSLQVDQVSEDQQVTEQVRKEQFDTDGVDTDRVDTDGVDADRDAR